VTGVAAGEPGGLGEPADDTEPTEPGTGARVRRLRPAAGRTSGRERHDEKITVYVSQDELVAIEQARLVEAFDEKVFHTAIARTVRFPETTVAGEPIITYAPSSGGAVAYRDLAKEVLARCLAG
jgi:hypothetical protein